MMSLATAPPLLGLPLLALLLLGAEASMSDCWDPDKLVRMQFNKGKGKKA